MRAGIAYSNADRYAIERADPTRRVKQESGAGAVVALDPRTGEVLAMVSFPHYDNQLFVDGISQRKYLEYASEEANKPLVTFYMRGESGETLKSLASLPAGRMVGKPLYVLTSGNSAIAAEEFIGHIGGYKLGELIGETSAGAGFRN